jgi:hypothetical protein
MVSLWCGTGLKQGSWTIMSTAAILIARIRNRERVMQSIVRRNPEAYRTNAYYQTLQSAVVAYRDSLTQLERLSVGMSDLVHSR